MKSIIEDIFFGTRGNLESIDFGETYWKLVKEEGEINDKFMENLTAEQKVQFENVLMQNEGSEAEAQKVLYIEGFKTGFLIAVECFTK